MENFSPRFWIISTVGVVVVVGFGLLLALLGRRPEEPAPTAAPTSSTELPTATVATSPISVLPTKPSDASPISTPEPQLPSRAAVPEVAPDFSLPQSGGGKFRLADELAQGPVVLVFFQRVGGWRPDPQLVELQEQYETIQETGAEVTAAVVADIETVENWCQRAGISYPVLADSKAKASEAYGVYNLLGDRLAAPAVFIIDTDRSIVWAQVGEHPRDFVSGQTILEHLP